MVFKKNYPKMLDCTLPQNQYYSLKWKSVRFSKTVLVLFIEIYKHRRIIANVMIIKVYCKYIVNNFRSLNI